MRELSKKVGSLALGVGSLAFLLANAAMTHGCGGSRPAPPVTQAGTPPVSAEPGPTAAPAEPASADDDCQEQEYMHATKAPIWKTSRKCRGETTGDEPQSP